MGDATSISFLICRSMFSRKLIIPTLLIVPNILLWAGILAVDGVIIQRDFNFPLYNENFESSYHPLWNDVTSQTNIERFPRLVMMSPFLALSMMGVEVAVITKVMIISAFAFMVISTYLFTKALMQRFNLINGRSFTAKLVPLIGSYLFAYSPTSMQFSWEISFIASLATLPLMLYFIVSKPTSRYLPFLLAVCLLFSLAHPFFLVVNIIVSIIFFLIMNYRTIALRFTVSKIVLAGILAIPILAWLWVPYMAAPASSIELGRDAHLERSIFDTVSDNNLYKILFLERDKFAYVDTAPDDLLSQTFHYLSLALLVSGAFVCFIFIQRWIPKRIMLFLGGGFIVMTLLSLGSSGILGEPYWLLVSESGIGWIFRSPLKFQLYQAFFLCILFTASMALIRQKINHKLYVPAFMMAVLIGSSYHSVYHANSLSLNPIEIPEEYHEISSYLETNGGDSKVLYLPRYNELPTTWSQGHMIAPFDMKSSQLPTFDTYLGYNYVREMLYDYPYTTNMLGSEDFYELLSSVGIRYIVFHNDRGYSIDQKNLDFILDSNLMSILYNKNDWYLFEIKDQSTGQIRLIYEVAEVEGNSDLYSFASQHLAVIDRSQSNAIGTTIPENSPIVKFRKANDILRISTENMIHDPSFTFINNDDYSLWNAHVAGFETVSKFDDAMSVNYLQVSTNSTSKNVWSWIIGDQINVNPRDTYLFSAEVQTQNVYGSHIKIQGFDEINIQWKDILFITRGASSSSRLSITGDTDWKLYSQTLQIPEDMRMIRYVINAGSVLENSAGVAQTLIRNPGVYTFTENTIDSDQQSIIDYRQVDSSHYEVHLNNEGPIILATTTAYDKGWVAIDEKGNELPSIPIYGMVNGFYVEEPGNHSIMIKYKPQEFSQIGAVLSSVGFFISVIYVIGPLRASKVRLLFNSVQEPRVTGAVSISCKKNPAERFCNTISPFRSDGVYLDSDKNTEALDVNNPMHVNPIIKSPLGRYNQRLVDGQSVQIKYLLVNLIKTDSSHLPIVIAIALMMSIALMIPLGSTYVNLVAAYALGSIAIGLIWKSIFERQRAESVISSKQPQ